MPAKAKKKVKDCYVSTTAIAETPEEFNKCIKAGTHYEVNVWCGNCGCGAYAFVKKGVEASGLKCPNCECDDMYPHIQPPKFETKKEYER